MSGFEFGIQGSSNQRFAVDWANGNMIEIAQMQNRLPRTWDELAQPGSELATLLEQLPSGPVDLRRTLFEGLWTAYVCLEEIAMVAQQQREGAAPSIMADLRAALLASGRVLFTLLPDTAESRRVERATTVMAQEADSLHRLYKEADAYRKAGIVNLPPEAEVAESRRLAKEMLKYGRPPGDAKMLQDVATVSAQVLARERQDEATDIERHPLWIFNVGSGFAHGYGWPSLLWRVGSLPTNTPGDYMLTSILVHQAHRLVLEQAGIGLE